MLGLNQEEWDERVDAGKCRSHTRRIALYIVDGLLLPPLRPRLVS